MGIQERGFTIIELLLFVTISGVLIATLLGGWSVSINTQSYKDSLRSLSSQLKSQYTDTFSVQNDRTSKLSCLPNDVSKQVRITQNNATGSTRGTSDCVVVGRYMVIGADNMIANDIIGFDAKNIVTPDDSELSAMKKYQPTRLPAAIADDTTFLIPWSSTTYAPGGNESIGVNFAMVIVRSPSTGTAHTYTKDFPTADRPPTALDVIENGTQLARSICLNPQGPILQDRMAVVIGAQASSADSVNIVGAQEAGC